MPLGVTIPFSEAMRYMGSHNGVSESDTTVKLMTDAIRSLELYSSPKYVSREFTLNTGAGNDMDSVISLGSFSVRSVSLARNLKGCTRAVLFAATIGPQADRLCKRAQLTSMAQAACYQAAGAAAIEALCDYINSNITRDYKADGFFTRPRFSPGYGDVSLEHQKDWFRELDITRNCGIELTDSLLMIPTKSVTAIIGLSPDDRESCSLSQSDMTACDLCDNSSTCAFTRKEQNI